MNRYFVNKFGDKIECKPIHFACNACKEDKHDRCTGVQLLKMESTLRPGKSFITKEEAAWNCYCFRNDHTKKENDEEPTKLPQEYLDNLAERKESARKSEDIQKKALERIDAY